MGSESCQKLELLSAIGFNGKIHRGLVIHPDREHMIYPLGCTLIIRNLITNKQEFLKGHSNNVSCLAVSTSGKFIASGQVTHMGFKADIIVWDYHNKKLLSRLSLHKVKVEALAISPNELYIVSLGGQDDSSVVVWDLKKAEAICGAPASVPSAGIIHCLSYSSKDDNVFITAGDGTLRMWQLNVENRKIRPTECNTGQLRRIVKCIEVDSDDDYFYCGTTTGDILKINMKSMLMSDFGPSKDKFSLGITDIKALKNGSFLVGSGEGIVAIVRRGNNGYAITKKQRHLKGAITSLALRGEGHQFYAGTDQSEISRFNFTEFESELVMTAHSRPVLDVCFPIGCSDLVATCSENDIRVWHTTSSRELLRITEANMVCSAIVFMPDGRALLSAWNDGKIRAYLPESGKLWWVINNAHCSGVTALAVTSDNMRILSGGGEGQVRIWEVSYSPLTQNLQHVMKEHKSTVTCIKVHSDNKECVTASTDGTCIVWDLLNFIRKQMVLANSLFQCVCYHPKGYQIVTSGTDRKLAYWDTFDGSQIREVVGSVAGGVNGMDMTGDGQHIATGGGDKLVKLWNYDDGVITSVGEGHSGVIFRIRICPNHRFLCSVSQDGAILIWRFPNYQDV